ncbi:hypothetical protein Droror1_Dr00021871 [Drosera rotundifolia]
MLLHCKFSFCTPSFPLLSSLRIFSSSSDSTSSRVLKAGDVLRETRIFSSHDVIDYSKVSRDVNPIHLDSEVAMDAGFGGRVVHGMLVASLFPRIIAAHFPGAVYASQTLHFRSPVCIGDEIAGVVQVSSIRETKKKYMVKFLTKCINSNDIVLDGEAVAVLPSLLMEEAQSLHGN